MDGCVLRAGVSSAQHRQSYDVRVRTSVQPCPLTAFAMQHALPPLACACEAAEGKQQAHFLGVKPVFGLRVRVCLLKKSNLHSIGLFASATIIEQVAKEKKVSTQHWPFLRVPP